MISKSDHLKDLIEKKTTALWTAQWELGFMHVHHAKFLTPEALRLAREALAKARSSEADSDVIQKLNEDVEQVKDTQKLHENLERFIADMTTQITYLENLTV